MKEKFRRSLSILTAVLQILFFSVSCSFFTESQDEREPFSLPSIFPPRSFENNPNVAEYGAVGESLFLNISFNEFLTRSAVPSFLGIFLSDPALSIETSIEEISTGYRVDGLASIIDDASEKKIRAVFMGLVFPVDKSYALTVKIKKTGFEKSFMEGKINLTVPAYSKLMNAQEKLILCPGEENTATGSVDLKLIFGTEYKASIDSVSIAKGFVLTNTAGAVNNTCSLMASGISSGTYEVTFSLLTAVENEVSFKWTESIVVYPELLTDMWVSTGTNEKNIINAGQTEFYVRGNNSTPALWNAYGSEDASDSTGTGSRKRPYATLQKAVNSIIVLNTINPVPYTIYCDGTFGINEGAVDGSVLKISTEDANPLVLNVETMSDSGIILDGTGSSLSVFYIEKNVTLNAKNMTVQNGGSSAINGGGIYVGYGCGMILTDCTVKKCTAKFGGGIYIAGSSAAQSTAFFNNTKILENSAKDSGGGIYVGEDTIVYMGEVNSIVALNDATGIANPSCGGGVFVKGKSSGASNGTFVFTNGYITGNKSCYGGGVYLGGSTEATKGGNFSISGGVISGNIANDSFGGGAVRLNDNSIFSLTSGLVGGDLPADSTVALTEQNLESIKQMGNYSYGNGGAFSLASSSKLTLLLGSIKNNRCYVAGNGIYSEGSISLSSNSRVHVSNDIHLANAVTAENKNYGLTLSGVLAEDILVSLSKTYEEVIDNSFVVAKTYSTGDAQANENKIKLKSSSADDNDGQNQSYKYCVVADGINLLVKRVGVGLTPSLPGEYRFVIEDNNISTNSTGLFSFKVTDSAGPVPNELTTSSSSIAILQGGNEIYKVTSNTSTTAALDLGNAKFKALPEGTYQLCMTAVVGGISTDDIQNIKINSSVPVEDFDQIHDMIASVAPGETLSIKLDGDITKVQTESVTHFNASSGSTVRLIGNGVTRTKISIDGNGKTNVLGNASNNATLILENIEITDFDSATAFSTTTGGTIQLINCKISGVDPIYSPSALLANIMSGKLIMDGGIITGNTNGSGNTYPLIRISEGCSFIMRNGAKIENNDINTACVKIDSNGTFTMESGAEINQPDKIAVQVAAGGVFNQNGCTVVGEIR